MLERKVLARSKVEAPGSAPSDSEASTTVEEPKAETTESTSAKITGVYETQFAVLLTNAFGIKTKLKLGAKIGHLVFGHDDFYRSESGIKVSVEQVFTN